MTRRPDADGVAERELAGAEVVEALADLDHLVDRHVALPGVAEAHADVGAHVEPGVAGADHGGLEHRELLVEAAVEVALREGLGRAAEDRDVAAAELEGAVESAFVRHQHGQLLAGLAELALDQQAHQLGGVGQLGHPLGVHEAGGLDDGQAGGEQAPDELGLRLDRDDALLVLQAVARADLVDRDRGLGQRLNSLVSLLSPRRAPVRGTPAHRPLRRPS